MLGLKDAERTVLDAQLLEPIVQLHHLLGKRLDALLVGETVAQGLDVLDGLREVRGRPPHVARDLAVASLQLLLHLLEDHDLGAGIRRGDGSRESGMPRSHDYDINFLIPLGRNAFRLCRLGHQSAGHASGSHGRAGGRRAFEKLATIHQTHL